MGRITIKMIAEKAGVSRGTVDRVLNNRPYVNEEIRQRVLQIVKELDYKPNLAAKALKSNDRQMVIRVIVPSERSKYSQEIRKGVQFAQKDYASVGITVDVAETEEISPDEQLVLLQRAEEDGVAGIAIIPYEDERITRKLRELSEKIPVVTLNTKVGDVGDICYVGQDHCASGSVAAQLMGLLTKGEGNVLISMGFEAITSHKQRRDGFASYIQRKYPKIHICDSFENLEDDEKMYHLMEEKFARYGHVDGIYVCAGGIKGLCDYLQDHDLAGKTAVICTNAFDYEAEMLKVGVIDFAIGEQLFEQGYFSIKILAAYLLDGEVPKAKNAYTNIDIRSSENINYSFLR